MFDKNAENLGKRNRSAQDSFAISKYKLVGMILIY